LLVEISYSTLDYDLNEKKHSYANAGIPEYWIVDLENQRLIVFRNPQDRDYNETFEYRAGVVELMAFPEVKLEVIRLLIDLN
jgi:Uma2 family endonuclease